MIALFKAAFREFRRDRPMQLSAALSFYTLLSLAPLLLVTVAVVGLVFEHEAVQGRIVSELRGLMGEAGGEVAQTVIANADQLGKNVFSIVIGVLTLLFGATTVFVQLQDALNQIWGVEKPPETVTRGVIGAVLNFLRERLLSLTMVLGIGFLLLVSLLISAALSAFSGWSGESLGWPEIMQAVNAVVSLGVVTLLFALIFKLLPDVDLEWRDVWFGAAVTAVLFTAGKFLIGLYLGRASVGSAYGAAGSVVVLMVWVYYASLIVFFGAELTQVHAQRSSTKISRAGGDRTRRAV